MQGTTPSNGRRAVRCVVSGRAARLRASWEVISTSLQARCPNSLALCLAPAPPLRDTPARMQLRPHGCSMHVRPRHPKAPCGRRARMPHGSAQEGVREPCGPAGAGPADRAVCASGRRDRHAVTAYIHTTLRGIRLRWLQASGRRRTRGSARRSTRTTSTLQRYSLAVSLTHSLAPPGTEWLLVGGSLLAQASCLQSVRRRGACLLPRAVPCAQRAAFVARRAFCCTACILLHGVYFVARHVFTQRTGADTPPVP